MAPIVFNKINFLNTPISLKLFGSHKTYRGFFFGIMLSIIVTLTQKILSPLTTPINLLDYSEINIFFFGFMMGLCALLWDLIKSFINRKYVDNIKHKIKYKYIVK